jgi:hypothetical protein
MSAMVVESVPVADLHVDPGNVRRHPERNLASLKASLARFGQQKPLVVDANNVVRAGNGTLEAARALGWATIDVVRSGLSGTDLVAYSVADNQIALTSEWDQDGLASTLRALQEEEFDLDAIGFTAAEVDAMFERQADEAAGLHEGHAGPPAAKPNPRHLPIDVIFTIGGADGSCCLACHAGLRYGLQSADYDLCPYADRYADGRHKVCFVDNDYRGYDHAVHLEVVRTLRPKYCTTRDVMTRTQSAEAGAEFYELGHVLDMAAELEQYAENVIVIPKYDCLDAIPDRYVLGYSIPTSHGGTPLPPEMFKGRRVHLLGGSWKKQSHYLALLGEGVVSLDNNDCMKIASDFGEFSGPDGSRSGPLSEVLGFRVTNPRFVALAISLGAIGWAINEICGRRVAAAG